MFLSKTLDTNTMRYKYAIWMIILFIGLISVQQVRAPFCLEWGCLATSHCSDTGTTNGGGTCQVLKESCDMECSLYTTDGPFNDTCGGTVDTPNVKYYYCATPTSNFCSNATTSATDTCGSSGACSGTPNACSTYVSSGQSACTTNFCTWTAATCTGTPTACASRGSGTCNATFGCSWYPGSCYNSGGSCSGYSDATSCNNNGCWWEWTSPETGICTDGGSCGYSDQTSCQADPSCYWDPSYCYGTASACSTFASNQTNCQGTGGCSYTAATCTGSPSCSSYTSSSPCTSGGCSWSGSGCSATNYYCSGSPGTLGSTASSGTTGRSSTCTTTTYSCTNSDGGSTTDTCSAGTSYVPSGQDTYNDCTASYNSCTGTGSPYKCQKTGPDGNCNGAGACNSGGNTVNVANNYVCTGSGTETAASTTYYAFSDAAYTSCSAPTSPTTGFGTQLKNVYGCNGANGQGSSVGTLSNSCGTGCCNPSTPSSCVTSGSSASMYNFGSGDVAATDYCLSAVAYDCNTNSDCLSGFTCIGKNCVGTLPRAFKDGSNVVLMYMDEMGRVAYKGTLYQSTGASPSSTDVKFAVSGYGTVVWLKPSSGDFYLKGTIHEWQGSLTVPSNAIKFRNSTGSVAYIDSSGNLYLRSSANKMG